MEQFMITNLLGRLSNAVRGNNFLVTIFFKLPHAQRNDKQSNAQIAQYCQELKDIGKRYFVIHFGIAVLENIDLNNILEGLRNMAEKVLNFSFFIF